jgi:hypothetical protein
MAASLPELFTAIAAEVTKQISTLHRIKASSSAPGPAASEEVWLFWTAPIVNL